MFDKEVIKLVRDRQSFVGDHLANLMKAHNTLEAQLETTAKQASFASAEVQGLDDTVYGDKGDNSPGLVDRVAKLEAQGKAIMTQTEPVSIWGKAVNVNLATLEKRVSQVENIAHKPFPNCGEAVGAIPDTNRPAPEPVKLDKATKDVISDMCNVIEEAIQPAKSCERLATCDPAALHRCGICHNFSYYSPKTPKPTEEGEKAKCANCGKELSYDAETGGKYYCSQKCHEQYDYSKKTAPEEAWPTITQEIQKSAFETLIRLGYTYNGGKLWKPPLGKPCELTTLRRKLKRAEELLEEIKRRGYKHCNIADLAEKIDEFREGR